MQCHMKWKHLLFCISAAIVILLINAITGQLKKDSTEPYALARSQPKAEEDFQEMDQLMCPKAVEATVGGNVTLDFHFKSQRNVTRELIEWKFNNSIHVLVYRSRGVSDSVQADQFKSRASLESIDNIAKGKLAVKISSLTKMDAGTYSCIVGHEKSCSVELTISNQEVIIQDPISTPKPSIEEHVNPVIFIFIKIVIAGVILVPAFVLFKKWTRAKKIQVPTTLHMRNTNYENETISVGE